MTDQTNRQGQPNAVAAPPSKQAADIVAQKKLEQGGNHQADEADVTVPLRNLIGKFFKEDEDLKFAGRSIKKFVLFCVIALLAIAFHIVVQWVEHLIPKVIVDTLLMLTYVALALDVIWFVIQIVKEILAALDSVFSRPWTYLMSALAILLSGAFLSEPIKAAIAYVLRVLQSAVTK